MNNINKNNLKELKLWLCASLKNSEAQLICENNCSNNDINNKIDKIITELEELKIILMTNDNNKNNKRCGDCNGRDRK